MIKERVRALDFIDAHELVDEFARNIRQELDYKLEARHADHFRRNFARLGAGRRAEGLLGATRAGRILTLEYLDGVQFADLDLEATSLEERRELAYRATETWMEMIFRHGFFHGDPHPANMLVLAGGRIGLVDFGLVGKLTDDDMARLTALFVDAATENVDALPRRLGGARRPLSEGARGGVQDRAARPLLPLLRREPRRDRPDPGDPGGVRAHLLDEPAPADALRPPGQGDRDARRGRRRPLSGLQRLRGGPAVRARADAGALLAAAGRVPGAEAGAGAVRDRARAAVPAARRAARRCATARSRSVSSTRGWTSSCTGSTSSSTGS